MYIMAGRNKGPKIVTEVIEDDKFNAEVKVEPETNEEKIVTPKANEINDQTQEDIKNEPVSSFEEKTAEIPDTKKISSFRDLDASEKSDVLVEKSLNDDSVDLQKPITEDSADLKNDTMTSDEAKKWLSEVKPEITKETNKKSFSFLKFIFILLLVLGFISLVGGGIYYYQKNVMAPTDFDSDQKTSDESSPTPTSTPKVEEIDYSTLKVNILNGSGIAGEAGKAKALLDEFEFSSVETGNASSYNFTDTIISLKEEVNSQIYENISEALSENYSVAKNDKSLDTNSDYDIVITVGSKKAN